MALPEKGISEQQVMDTLVEYREGDVDWRSGKVFAYVFNAGEELERVVKKAYMEFLTENCLDPTSFPSLVKMETEVVRFVADLLRGDENVVGNFTSGGTESILLAVKTARDRALAEKPRIKEPEMVFPRTAHCSFHKAAQYFGLKPVVTDFDPINFRADPASIRDAITDNTVLVIASAPSYAQGVIDPIAEIGEIALERGVMFHVDACMGGIMLSVMRESGSYNLPDFDFTVPGVTSISADLHKFGYAAKGASVVLYRNSDIRQYQIFASTGSITYALVNPTIASTKSGGPVAGAWAAIHYLGMEGYRRITEEVMESTRKTIEGINATGDLRVLGKPDMSIFSFASDTINVFQLADRMAKRGWFLQPQFRTDRSPANLHITLMHLNVKAMDEFLADLPECIEEVKAGPEQIDLDAVSERINGLVEALGENAAEQLAAMVGVDDVTDLPEDTAMITSALNALPRELAEKMLVDYINQLYR